MTQAIESVEWPPRFDRPRTRRETIAVYGDPSGGGKYSCEDEEHVDPAWRGANIVELHGENAIPQIPGRFYFHTHRLVVAGVRAGFAAAALACPEYVIDEAGSWVPRHMRHNPDMPLSPHTWGCAVDLNEAKNAGRYIPHRELPEPWSDGWKKLWPAGLPRAYVEAWKAKAWKWGGDWTAADHRGLVFVDPMHVYYGV